MVLTPPNDGKEVVVTGEGEETKDDCEGRIVEDVVTRVEGEGVDEENGVGEEEGGGEEKGVGEEEGVGGEKGVGEEEGVGEKEVIKEEAEVVRLEPVVEEGTVVNDETDEVEENVESGSSEDVEVEEKESGGLVEVDKNEEEGSSVSTDELKPGGRVVEEIISVEVGRGESVSVDSESVGVWVSNVPVLDGNMPVNVGSPGVGVGDELTSKGVESGGVDIEVSVGVSVKKEVLERCRCLVKNGGGPPVKLKGENAGEAISDDSGSSSLMERFDGPQGDRGRATDDGRPVGDFERNYKRRINAKD